MDRQEQIAYFLHRTALKIIQEGDNILLSAWYLNDKYTILPLEDKPLRPCDLGFKKTGNFYFLHTHMGRHEVESWLNLIKSTNEESRAVGYGFAWLIFQGDKDYESPVLAKYERWKDTIYYFDSIFFYYNKEVEEYLDNFKFRSLAEMTIKEFYHSEYTQKITHLKKLCESVEKIYFNIK